MSFLRLNSCRNVESLFSTHSRISGELRVALVITVQQSNLHMKVKYTTQVGTKKLLHPQRILKNIVGSISIH